MAKQSLPSVELSEIETKRRIEAIQQDIDSVRGGDIITTQAEGYVSRRVDIKLSRDAALKLRDKTRQLQDTGAKTADGRFVTNKTQAIQWIFENEVIV